MPFFLYPSCSFYYFNYSMEIEIFYSWLSICGQNILYCRPFVLNILKILGVGSLLWNCVSYSGLSCASSLSHEAMHTWISFHHETYIRFSFPVFCSSDLSLFYQISRIIFTMEWTCRWACRAIPSSRCFFCAQGCGWNLRAPEANCSSCQSHSSLYSWLLYFLLTS